MKVGQMIADAIAAGTHSTTARSFCTRCRQIVAGGSYWCPSSGGGTGVAGRQEWCQACWWASLSPGQQEDVRARTPGCVPR